MAEQVNLDELMTPVQAVEYLRSRNVKRTELTLAKGRWRRDGSTPPHRKIDSRVYYIRSDIDGWLRDKLSPPFVSTSAHAHHEVREEDGDDGASVVPRMSVDAAAFKPLADAPPAPSGLARQRW